MADAGTTDEELAQLVQHTEEATSAWMRGDMDRYLPDQDWSLRVTQVHRRDGSDWQLVASVPKRICERSVTTPARPVLAGALLLVSCGGGGGEAGPAERFCRAYADVSATAAKEAEDRPAPADVERQATAALEALPDDAPDAVQDYFGALRELTALSKVWENPQTGGIKEEYLDDLQRLFGVIEDSTDATSRFVAERCPGAPRPAAPLSRLGGIGGTPSGRPGGEAQAPSARPRCASCWRRPGGKLRARHR